MPQRKRFALYLSPPMRTHSIINQGEDTLHEKVRTVIERSMLVHVLRPLVTTLCLIFEQPHCYEMVSALLPLLMKLMVEMDLYNSKNPDALGTEFLFDVACFNCIY